MTTETRYPRLAWLRSFGGLDWRTEDRVYVALLDALVLDRVAVEVTERQMDAPARGPTEGPEEQERELRDELADAHSVLQTFRKALEDLAARIGGHGNGEVAYDAANPDEDQCADVLIQYLVRPGYAEVRTEELEPGHFRYSIKADWPRLRQLAEAQGQQLPL